MSAERQGEGEAVAGFLAGLLAGTVDQARRDGMLRARVFGAAQDDGGFLIGVDTGSGLRLHVRVRYMGETPPEDRQPPDRPE